MHESARKRIEALKALLKDKDADVRTAAANGIERLEGACGLEEILRTLKTGEMGAKIRALCAWRDRR